MLAKVQNQKVLFQNYQTLQKIGEEKFSQVYKGNKKNIQTDLIAYHPVYPQIRVAIKLGKFQSSNSDLRNEAQMLSQLEHPNIIRLIEYRQLENMTFLAQELAEEGELFNYAAEQPFSEDMARTVFHQLIDGISYCHNNAIAHRDIKLDNLLLDSNFNLKIADFGFATKYNKHCLLEDFLGTESYMAPEIQQRQPYSGELVDVFACGAVLFMMHLGAMPFQQAVFEDIRYKHIINCQNYKFWEIHSFLNQNASLEFQDLINGMLAYYPTQRFTLTDIKNHPWYQGNILDQETLKYEFLKRKQNHK